MQPISVGRLSREKVGFFPYVDREGLHAGAGPLSAKVKQLL
jgi:hypothetical protein